MDPLCRSKKKRRGGKKCDDEAGSEQAAIEGNAFAALPAPADGNESANDISDEFGANDSGGDDDYPYID